MLRKAIADIQAKYVRKDVPNMRAGDTVRVHTKIKEGDKERIQIFEGVVVAYRKGMPGSSMFTVRKMSYGVGVERMFPVHSPRIDRIEVLGHGEVRRSRLYYLRALQGKAARLHQEEGAGEGAPAPARIRLRDRQRAAGADAHACGAGAGVAGAAGAGAAGRAAADSLRCELEEDHRVAMLAPSPPPGRRAAGRRGRPMSLPRG